MINKDLSEERIEVAAGPGVPSKLIAGSDYVVKRMLKVIKELPAGTEISTEQLLVEMGGFNLNRHA